MSRIDEIIDDLDKRKKAISCNGKGGLLLYLQELGFTWKDSKTEGHKVFVHKELTAETSGEFTTYSVDCGHKPNRDMKFQYVANSIRVLKKYRTELTILMERKNEKI